MLGGASPFLPAPGSLLDPRAPLTPGEPGRGASQPLRRTHCFPGAGWEEAGEEDQQHVALGSVAANRRRPALPGGTRTPETSSLVRTPIRKPPSPLSWYRDPACNSRFSAFPR